VEGANTRISNKGNQGRDLKATRTHLQMQKGGVTSNIQAPQLYQNTQSRKKCYCEATPATSLPSRATAVYITLTLHKRHAQCRMGTSEKCPPGGSKTVRRNDIAQGKNVPYDEVAEAPICFNARRRKRVFGAQMPHMHTALAPVAYNGGSATTLGSHGDVGRAVLVNPRDIQQGGTTGLEKGCPHVSSLSLMASCCNTNQCVTVPSTRIAACASREATESPLAEIVPTHMAPHLRRLQLLT
jgi:hypothetical protein